MNQTIRFISLQIMILIGLFLVAEITVQSLGYKPGVIEDFYFFNSEPVYNPSLVADKYGITHMVKGKTYIKDQKVNIDGFASRVEHSPEVMDSLRSENTKIVFLIGDSFTHGCCPDSYKNSFSFLLNQNPEFEALNFGVGGADPLHYELIAKKYTPLLKPDLICVFVYFGNDEMPYDRTPKPYIPLAYPIMNGPWLMSEAPINLGPPNHVFRSFEESKDFYFEHLSLWGDNRNAFEKLIRYSAILSRVYLKWEEYRTWKKLSNEGKIIKPEKYPPYSYRHLRAIESLARENNSEILFFGIPTPKEAENKTDLKKKYPHIFKDIEYYFPGNLSYTDYDGKSVANHFNASGHKRFKDFIEPYILDKLK